MRTLFELGFRNSFGSIMGQGEGTTTTLPKKETNLADIIAQGFRSAGEAYGAYTEGQIAKLKKETEEIRQRTVERPGMLPPPSGNGGISPNTLFIAGAVGVVGIILALTLK